MPRDGFDLDVTADETGSFLHTGKPQTRLASCPGHIKPATVVLHLQTDALGVGIQDQLDPLGLRVSGCIAQRLLGNSNRQRATSFGMPSGSSPQRKSTAICD